MAGKALIYNLSSPSSGVNLSVRDSFFSGRVVGLESAGPYQVQRSFVFQGNSVDVQGLMSESFLAPWVAGSSNPHQVNGNRIRYNGDTPAMDLIVPSGDVIVNLSMNKFIQVDKGTAISTNAPGNLTLNLSMNSFLSSEPAISGYAPFDTLAGTPAFNAPQLANESHAFGGNAICTKVSGSGFSKVFSDLSKKSGSLALSDGDIVDKAGATETCH